MKFKHLSTYGNEKSSINLLPFRFERIKDGVLVSNIVGEFTKLSNAEFSKLISLDFDYEDPFYHKAYTKQLVINKGQIGNLQLLGMRLRSRMAFLKEPTALHIFVVTLRCEHSCPYCQVSRQSADTGRFDMTELIAEKALKIALDSPSKTIKIEFQGGEPLLNFSLIEKIVANAQVDALKIGKKVDFVIASNLALLNENILDFCKNNNILLSTSLDGPRELHNKNRPRPGNNSYELAVDGIRSAQKALGNDRVGALMTTTESSLNKVEEIIDEYVNLNFDGVFLRPLSPYGFAIKTKQITKYDSTDWLNFYKKGLRYILDINKGGHKFIEFYSTLVLTRLLTDEAIGYVDLRSPAGIGLGAMVYNYNGKIFASDEARMLAEMGDTEFVLGDVFTNDYKSLVTSEKLINAIAVSLSQTAPECINCVYEPYCGSDPVYHHATQKDYLGIKPISNFCKRQKGVMGHLIEILNNDDADSEILKSWISK